MNGTSRCREKLASLYIAWSVIGSTEDGFWKERTTSTQPCFLLSAECWHVHRASLPLRLQLSRRCFLARELSLGLRQSEYASNGAARPRRRLRLATLPYGGEKSANQG